MEETEKRKQTINMILRASLICFICCLSAAWAVYGRILLESLGLKGWWIVLALFIFLVIVSVCCCIRQKKWREIVTVAFFLGLAFFLPLEFKWQGLLAALCLGLAMLMPAWRSLPKKSHRSLKPQEDVKMGRSYMYHLFWKMLYSSAEDCKEDDRGVCIAVTGEWGSGKSHFLSHTIYELDCMGRLEQLKFEGLPKREPYTGAFSSYCVDLWKPVSEDDMWREIANGLAYTARGYRSDCFLGNRLVKSVLQLCHLPLPLADDTAKLLSLGGDGETLIHSRIGREIQEHDQYSLLVLDNIDRCSIGRLRALFPVIESLAKIPRLVILCGVAKGNMTTIMGREAPSLCAALMKICDDEIHIPQMSHSESSQYLLRLKENEREKSDKRLDDWFRKTELYDMTPRLVKKIRNHLCRFTKMHQRYLSQPKEEGDFDIDVCCECIFSFEALRIAFPEFPIPIRDWEISKTDKNRVEHEEGIMKKQLLPFDNDQDEIDKERKKLIEDILKDKTTSHDAAHDELDRDWEQGSSDNSAFKKWREHIRLRYGTVMYGEEDPTRYGMYRIAISLSLSTDDCLERLRNHEYTNLARLTDDECKTVLTKLNIADILESEERGAEFIGNAIGGHVESDNMHDVLRSLYDYCVSKSELPKCLLFMKTFFGAGWHLKLDLQNFFPLDYATVLLSQKIAETDIDYFCQYVLDSYNFESLANIADIILTCVQKKDVGKYDYIFNGRKVASKTRMMLQTFHERWNEPSYRAILVAVLKEYAKKVSSHKGLSMDLVLFALKYIAFLCSRDFSSAKEMAPILHEILSNCGLESLARIANIILTCVQDKDAWNYEYIFNGREVAWATRKMLQSFHEKWNDPSYKAALDAVLEEYAKKACKFILAYDGRRDRNFYSNLILGQSNQPKSYGPALLAGAKQYLASYASKSSDIPQLLKTVTVVDALSDRPVPFAALSFAVIWKVLFKKLVTPKELEEANKEEIRKLQKLITATPPLKKGVSKQIKDNWQAALNVFKNSLK